MGFSVVLPVLEVDPGLKKSLRSHRPRRVLACRAAAAVLGLGVGEQHEGSRRYYQVRLASGHV